MGVMKEMNRLMNVPEMQQTMQQMQREMMRAEMLDDLMEEGFAESDDEAEIDTEIAKVFQEVGLDKAAFISSPDEVHMPAVAGPATAATPAAAVSATTQADDDLM